MLRPALAWPLRNRVTAFAGRIQSPNIMRALLVLLPVVLAGCGSSGNPASQRQILKQSQAEIALREPWAATAAIFVVEDPDDSVYFWRHIWKWKVKAGAFDYSDYPRYHGIDFVPGTERELRFTENGCLIDYIDRGNRCLSPATTVPTESPMAPEK